MSRWKNQPEIIVLDNFVRGRRENLRQAAALFPLTIVEGDIRDRQLLLGKLFEDVDIVFHQAAIRITQCAEEPRLAFDVLAGRDLQRHRKRRYRQAFRKVVAASSASVLGLADSFPTTEAASSLQQPHDLRRVQSHSTRGCCASFAEMYGLRYVALRYFNVYGPRMDTHGAYTEVLIRWMERLAAGQAAGHSRRRITDDGFRACARHRPRQHPGRESRCHG